MTGRTIIVRFTTISVLWVWMLWRYELPAPSAGQKNDITAWQECVNNSMAQLEHQAVRIENLELMSQYGTNGWKVYNECVTRKHLCQTLAVCENCLLTAFFFFSPTFSNLAFMIEMAQKELQKLRWRIGRTFGFERVLGRSFHVYQRCVVATQETNPRPKLAEEERSVGRRSQTARAWIKVGFWWFYTFIFFSTGDIKGPVCEI